MFGHCVAGVRGTGLHRPSLVSPVFLTSARYREPLAKSEAREQAGGTVLAVVRRRSEVVGIIVWTNGLHARPAPPAEFMPTSVAHESELCPTWLCLAELQYVDGPDEFAGSPGLRLSRVRVTQSRVGPGRDNVIKYT
jgi:hypothetical protein